MLESDSASQGLPGQLVLNFVDFQPSVLVDLPVASFVALPSSHEEDNNFLGPALLFNGCENLWS